MGPRPSGPISVYSHVASWVGIFGMAFQRQIGNAKNAIFWPVFSVFSGESLRRSTGIFGFGRALFCFGRTPVANNGENLHSDFRVIGYWPARKTSGFDDFFHYKKKQVFERGGHLEATKLPEKQPFFKDKVCPAKSTIQRDTCVSRYKSLIMHSQARVHSRRIMPFEIGLQ